jgi:hypothetical protein
VQDAQGLIPLDGWIYPCGSRVENCHEDGELVGVIEGVDRSSKRVDG